MTSRRAMKRARRAYEIAHLGLLRDQNARRLAEITETRRCTACESAKASPAGKPSSAPVAAVTDGDR